MQRVVISQGLLTLLQLCLKTASHGLFKLSHSDILGDCHHVAILALPLLLHTVAGHRPQSLLVQLHLFPVPVILPPASAQHCPHSQVVQ